MITASTRRPLSTDVVSYENNVLSSQALGLSYVTAQGCNTV